MQLLAFFLRLSIFFLLFLFISILKKETEFRVHDDRVDESVAKTDGSKFYLWR